MPCLVQHVRERRCCCDHITVRVAWADIDNLEHENGASRNFASGLQLDPSIRYAAGCISSHATSRRLNKLSMDGLVSTSAVSTNQNRSAKLAWL
jgi:hypothetical protein